MTSPIRDERDMDAVVRNWLVDDAGPPMDRNRQIGRIMGRVDETRQRRRLWPLNPFGRRAVHSATGPGADGAALARRGRVAALAPVRVVSLAALALLLATALLWPAIRPTTEPLPPGAELVDPADRALYGRMAALWAGPDSDLDTALETYAEDAVHDTLWLDTVIRTMGHVDIWDQMLGSAAVEPGRWIPLPDSPFGQRRYLVVESGSGEAACVFWVADDRITRHDCILPWANAGQDPASAPELLPPAPDAAAVRAAIMPTLSEGWAVADRDAIEQVVSPDIVHHVAYDNHEYTLEGIDAYMSVMGYGTPVELAPAIDLPAPRGEYRWADFSSVGTGSLCVFWARDGLVVRHDCIVPVATVPRTIAEPLEGDGLSRPPSTPRP